MCFFTALGTAIAASVGLTVGTTTAITAGTIGTGVATAVGIGATAVGALAITGAVAGGIMGIVSGAQSAEAQKQQAEYQAEVAANNSKLAYRRAENIELQANQKRAAILREAQQKRGSGRTGYAANGVVLGSGVTADYEADIANAYDLDLRNFNYDTASAAWQAKVQGVSEANSAALFRAQAGMYSQQKTTSIIGGVINTVGGTASSILNVATGLAALGSGKTLLKA